MNTLRALIFYAALIPLTLCFGTLGILLRPLDADRRYRIVTTWTHVSLWLLEVVCGVRCRVQGLENIPTTPSVVLCKHQSAWETMILQRYLPRQTWVMKQELMKIPFLGWGLGATDPVPVDRSAGRAALKQVISEGADRLAAGYW
ncbi:MAG: 1-acyl-sn-glycerol-3-phosphate acyltransferase, partial [Gammaproteobacteria bacterium]|nr:1-acyl-sn-glycerol-3-phosphate acyltransferase [Gammaproteobacteria bacterium]NNM01427.1 1-acyl-sn-glycerol-3-phosphate acyltransferase [Gammaproteobacteria bacterium]